MAIDVVRIINNPVSSNCFVVFDKAYNNECIIVDPGSEDIAELAYYLSINELLPKFVILTHEHFDHIWGVNCLQNSFPNVKLICNRKCSEMIMNKKKNCSLYYDQIGFELLAADIVTEDIDNLLSWQNREVKFYNTPGHSLGGICFIIGNNLFTGDTLIWKGKTITKLPGGSCIDLEKALNLLEGFKGIGLIVHAGHENSFKLDLYNIADAR